jgi:hypothetical protein
MAATTGYQAGIETNAVAISYGVEAAWGVVPATAFQAIRYGSETLRGQKQRSRPQEILNTYEAPTAITVQESAAGGINCPLAYGNGDDFLSVLMGADWQAPQVIAGIAADITITSGTKVLSSTLATKFSTISQGQWIRLLGFTNAGNNGFWYVVTKTDNSHLVLAGPGTIVTETPTGTLAQVRASTLLNGTQFKSLFVQKQFSSNKFLTYPGTFVTAGQLQGSVGQFLSCNFTCVSQQELKAVADSSTGAVVAAPTGRVNDPIGGFQGIFFNEVALAAAVDSFTCTLTRDGAAADYGMGSASAVGMRLGAMTVTGQLSMFFKDFTYYDNFKSETFGRLAIITKDAAGSAYVVTIPQAFLSNPQVNVQGNGQIVRAQFDLEGNPQAGGGTIRFDRLAAV